MKFEALTENTLCLLQMQELYNNSVFVVYSLSCVQLCDPIDCQAPLSMGFPRQEYQSVLSFPSPGDLPDLGIKPTNLCFYHCKQILLLWRHP